MGDWLDRAELLLGKAGLRRLQVARVALLGLGGVGGSCAEALCRAGVGHLLLCDGDVVDETNLSRQLFATRPELGQPKTEAAARRLQSINPAVSLRLERRFYLPEQPAFLYEDRPDVVLDAIDMVSAKIHLAVECARRGIPLVSCLGTGNRLCPQDLTVGDLSETSGCPLARVMRRELRKRGITHLRVVYSTETPQKAAAPGESGRHPPGSVSFVPPVAGYLLAGEAVRLLLQNQSPM